MTEPLRETLAKALWTHHNEYPWEQLDAATRAQYVQEVGAVLRALATWEPSMAVVRAAATMICDNDPVAACDAVMAALRAMAEEGT